MNQTLERAIQQLSDLANALDFLHEVSGPGLKAILFDLSNRASAIEDDLKDVLKAGGRE